MIQGTGAQEYCAVLGDRLWFAQTQQGHWAVRTLLAELRTPADAPSKPSTQVATTQHADLNQPVPELKLESTTLQDAIDALRDQTHSNIVVYWPDLEQIGIRRDTPVRLHLWNVTLDRALGAILTVAGGEYPGMLSVQDGVIVISSPERIRQGPSAIRVYDVRDLIAGYVAAHPQRVAPAVSNDALSTLNTTAAEEGADVVARLIEDDVDTDSWKDNGGSVGTIREFNGLLIVSQSPSAHREISELLRKLRSGEKPTSRPVLH